MEGEKTEEHVVLISSTDKKTRKGNRDTVLVEFCAVLLYLILVGVFMFLIHALFTFIGGLASEPDGDYKMPSTEDIIKNKIIVQRLQEDCLYELWWYNLGRLKGYPDAATPRCTTLHNMGIRPQFGIPKHLRIYADHAEADVPFPNDH